MTLSWSLFLMLTFFGSALGGLCRHEVSSWFTRCYGERFPIGTMVVNVSGCFLIGLIGSVPWDANAFPASREVSTLLSFGFLGGYTTVSSFTLNTLTLLQGGQWRPALFNVVGSTLFCLAAAFLGAAFTPW